MGNEDKRNQGRKRTKAQREADLAFVEQQVIQGRSHAEIAETLSLQRSYHISRQTISLDVSELTRRWQESTGESFAAARAKALRVLDAVHSEAFAGFIKSKQAGDGVGNPAFLQRILDTHDRRVKLQGLEAPARHEISGPEAGPIQIDQRELETPVSSERMQVVLGRFFDRHLAEKKAAGAETL